MISSKDSQEKRLDDILKGFERLVMVMEYDDKEAVRKAIKDNLNDYLKEKK